MEESSKHGALDTSKQTTDKEKHGVPDASKQTTDNDAPDTSKQTADKEKHGVPDAYKQTTDNDAPDTPKQTADKEKAEKLKQKRREQNPFFYCRFIAKYPVAAFLLSLFGHFILVFVCGILLGTGYDLFPTVFDNLPLELYDVPYRLRDLAWRDRDDYSNRVHRTLQNTHIPLYERGLPNVRGTVDLWYDSEGGNIFTKRNFLKIQEIEDTLVSDGTYKYSFCMTINASLACMKQKSILRYFDGTYSSIDPVFHDPNFDNITGVIYTAYTNNETRVKFEDFLPKAFSISPTKVSATLTRSLLLIGCSVSGKTKCSSYEDKTISFLLDNLKPKLQDLAKSAESYFDFYYFSYLVWREDVQKQAIYDMLFAIGSLLTIFLFMLLHTRSCWLTFWGVLSIMLSFVGTNFIYRVVFDFRYFGYFHILVIFIILGIGADDLFVFYDVWRLTAYSSYPSLAHRLSDAFRKTALSMFITSLTTMTAFVVSGFSPLLATKSFGIFAAFLVGYNYISVIVFFPTVVIIYHLKFENWTWPCCRCCKSSEDVAPEDFAYSGNTNIAFEHTESAGHKIVAKIEWSSELEMQKITDESQTEQAFHKSNGKIKSATEKENDTIENSTGQYVSRITVSQQLTENEISEEKSKNKESVYTSDMNGFAKQDNTGSSTSSSEVKISPTANGKKIVYEISIQAKHQKHQKKLVIFFRKYYFSFITNRIVRVILIPIFIGTVIFFAYQASFLEPDNEGLNVYKPDHPYAKSLHQQQYSMLHSTSDSLATIYIAFGLELKDRGGCHFSSINCRGTEVYDDEFDPNPVQNQLALKKFCDAIYKFSKEDISLYRIKKNRETGDLEVACFTRDLETFLLKENMTGINLTLPWDYSKVNQFMSALPTYYDASMLNQNFTKYVEIPIQYWLYNRNNMTYTSDYETYDDLIGEQTGDFTTSIKTSTGVTYGNSIKYIGIQINTTVNNLITGYTEGIPVIERWENFIKTQMKTMPKGVNKAFQLTRNTWHWLYVQKSLADNAITGIAVGVSLAFPILTIATMNIVIGFFATLSICCTTICVIGVIPLAGWKLGVLVSLNMCLLVGLAVDYVVHLAEGYNVSEHKDRLSRTRDMLEEMATSVFAGACTTLGASVFMFFTQITFFTQFGIFLFCTVGFSLFFSLGMFTVLMSLIGPQNDVGSLKVLFQKCKKKISR